MTPQPGDEVTLAEAGWWARRQLATLRRYWYVTLAISVGTTAIFVHALTTYSPSYVAGKQFVSVEASSNIFSGLGLSALGIGGIGSNPLSSGKGIVTVALSERIVTELLGMRTAGEDGELLEQLLRVYPSDGPFDDLLAVRDSLPPERIAVTVAAMLPELNILSAEFDIDTEFVTLQVETADARLTEDLLTAWYAALAEFYRNQLYGQKSKDLAVLQTKADSLRRRLASIEQETEAFKDNYQNLVRRTSGVRLKALARESLEAGAVYKTVLENLEVLRLNVETAAPVFAELNVSRSYAAKVKRPTLKYLVAYLAATGVLLGAALYLLPSPR